MFATRRALDFIAIQCALNRANVKIVAALPGIYSTFGPTHQGIDDLAHMRALPNMMVLDPCDNAEMQEAAIAAVEYDGPVYLRELLGRETRDVDRGAAHVRDRPGASCCTRAPTSASSRAASWSAGRKTRAPARRARHLRRRS